MTENKNRADGIIVKGIGGFYYVRTESDTIECHARGKFRKNELSPIVGDKVTIEFNKDGTGHIVEIHPRKNFLIRPGVANVDTLVLVSAAKSPLPDFLLLDKLLVLAESKGIEAIICLNKTDLAETDEVSDFISVYEKASYTCITASAKTGDGTDIIRNAIKGKTVAFAGLSGVGKSSLLKRITGVSLKTGDVSKIQRGKHTTRHVELMETSGGFVFDTPGFSRLEADEIRAGDLWQYFPEIAERHGMCKFRTCNHIGEKGCLVKEAVDDGVIANSRYENYISLFNKLKEIKDWERKD
ncbi:MAG: ribosome small subunit-dependent GTPase A [Ruminococcaceae bacterium]|nr:ribosome small subunit-dependent GTPase A [Oscillospiraceae bacterium]